MAYNAVLAGAATFNVNLTSNDVQISNYGSNSFQVTNTGDKQIARIDIDVTKALYPDSVFDPFGLVGDTVSKPLTIAALLGSHPAAMQWLISQAMTAV